MKILNITSLFILLLILTACLNPKVVDLRSSNRKVLTVFIDGTKNKINKNDSKNSNIARTFKLVKDSIPKFYIDGVFNNMWKLVGMEFGWGTKRRVKEAYLFLCNNYEKGDSICLFGYSRGATACRILSNVIYTAGIPDFKNNSFTDRQKKKIIDEIYCNYRGKRDGKYKASVKKEKVAQFFLIGTRKKNILNLA